MNEPGHVEMVISITLFVVGFALVIALWVLAWRDETKPRHLVPISVIALLVLLLASGFAASADRLQREQRVREIVREELHRAHITP